MVVWLQTAVAHRHGEAETAKFPQAVDDRIRDHRVVAMDVASQRHHALFGEAAKGIAHQRVVPVQAIVRPPALPLPQRLANGGDGMWRIRFFSELADRIVG